MDKQYERGLSQHVEVHVLQHMAHEPRMGKQLQVPELSHSAALFYPFCCRTSNSVIRAERGRRLL